MNLSEFAATARKVIVYTILGVIAYIVLSLLYRLAVNIYLTLNPPEEPPPTVGFGELPKLRLPDLEILGGPEFLLETPTGELPSFDDRTEVIAMAPQKTTLLGEEKARDLAGELDFGGSGTLSEDRRTLTFRDAPDQRTLAVNVVTQNFTLSTDLSRIASFPKGRAPSGAQAIETARKTLSQLGLLKFGFEAGNQTTAFYAVQDGAAAEVGSISEAQFTEVSFFRSLTEVGTTVRPILPPDPKVGLIRVWITTQQRPDVLNKLAIFYRAQEVEIDKSRVETYPLEGVANAWERVRSEQGIAYVELSGEISTVAVTGVALAYFDDPVHQDYLQPIYVFSGVARTPNGAEGEFVAYAPAVSSEWLSE